MKYSSNFILYPNKLLKIFVIDYIYSLVFVMTITDTKNVNKKGLAWVYLVLIFKFRRLKA